MEYLNTALGLFLSLTSNPEKQTLTVAALSVLLFAWLFLRIRRIENTTVMRDQLKHAALLKRKEKKAKKTVTEEQK